MTESETLKHKVSGHTARLKDLKVSFGKDTIMLHDVIKWIGLNNRDNGCWIGIFGCNVRLVVSNSSPASEYEWNLDEPNRM